MNLSIRQAITDDTALLAEIGASTFRDTFAPYHTKADLDLYIAKTYNTDAVAHNLLQTDIRYALACNEQQSAGYTKILLNGTHPDLTGKVAEIEKIYVRQQFLGTGTGWKLMEEACNYLKQLEYNTVFLGVWEKNERAIGFYKKFGFEQFSTRSFQLGQTLCNDYMLKLILS